MSDSRERNSRRRTFNLNEDDIISRFLAPPPLVVPQATSDNEQRPYPSSSSSSTPPSKKLPRLETPSERLEREAMQVHIPPQSMIGVDEWTTRACAKLSHVMYQAKCLQDLNCSLEDDDGGSVTMTPLLWDNHGALQATTPPFGAVLLESSSSSSSPSTMNKTLVLVWRGSITKMDWIVDLAVAPVCSQRWMAVAPQLRAHAGYTALVESDVSLHHEWLVDTILEKDVHQVICTGHSLAGAMAQIAHLSIQASLLKSRNHRHEDTSWSKLQKKDIVIRSIQFGAPMSCLCLHQDERQQKATTTLSTRTLLDELGQNSFNIVYGSDIMPRVPGNLMYMDQAIRHALVPFVKDALPSAMTSIIDLFPSVQQKLIDMYQEQTQKQDVVDMLKVCAKFEHLGSIVYYASVQAFPIQLSDEDFRTESQYQYDGLRQSSSSSSTITDTDRRYPNRRLRDHHVKFPAVLAAKKKRHE